MDLEFSHIIELLGVLTAILLAIVQYFDVEHLKKINKHKDNIENKKLPPETKNDKPEIINMRNQWDNLMNKEDFCRANALIIWLLILLAVYVLFTCLYVTQFIFFHTALVATCQWTVLVGVYSLFIMSCWSCVWLITTNSELKAYSSEIKSFISTWAVYQAYKPNKQDKE